MTIEQDIKKVFFKPLEKPFLKDFHYESDSYFDMIRNINRVLNDDNRGCYKIVMDLAREKILGD